MSVTPVPRGSNSPFWYTWSHAHTFTHICKYNKSSLKEKLGISRGHNRLWNITFEKLSAMENCFSWTKSRREPFRHLLEPLFPIPRANNSLWMRHFQPILNKTTLPRMSPNSPILYFSHVSFLGLFYVCECFACMYVCVPCVCLTWEGQKRSLAI